MTCCSLCLRVSREINNLLHLSDSSGSDGPPEADVQPHKHDEKPWNLDSLWYTSLSLGEHVADLQSHCHFWGGPGSARGCDAEEGWAAKPGEERSGIQCNKVLSCKMRPRKNCKMQGCLASLFALFFGKCREICNFTPELGWWRSCCTSGLVLPVWQSACSLWTLKSIAQKNQKKCLKEKRYYDMELVTGKSLMMGYSTKHWVWSKKSALHILLTPIFDGRRCSIKGKIYTKVYNETPACQAWESRKTPQGLWERWHTRTFCVHQTDYRPVQGLHGCSMGSSPAVLQHQVHHYPQLMSLIFLRGSSVLQGLGFLRIIDWGEEINGWVFYLLSYFTQGVNK